MLGMGFGMAVRYLILLGAFVRCVCSSGDVCLLLIREYRQQSHSHHQTNKPHNAAS